MQAILAKLYAYSFKNRDIFLSRCREKDTEIDCTVPILSGHIVPTQHIFLGTNFSIFFSLKSLLSLSYYYKGITAANYELLIDGRKFNGKRMSQFFYSQRNHSNKLRPSTGALFCVKCRSM